MNVIYESVGGEMFQTCLGALGRQGRLVVIGMMSQYGSGWPQTALKGVPEMLLAKSASLNGFFLIHYAPLFRKHLSQLTRAMMQGKLKVNMDTTVFRYIISAHDHCNTCTYIDSSGPLCLLTELFASCTLDEVLVISDFRQMGHFCGMLPRYCSTLQAYCFLKISCSS